jgi:hypothetical protein
VSERLTTTVKHFKDGVMSMGLTAAKHSIESWQEELKGYEGTGFKTIVTDLGHLHDELGKDDINGKKVGQLLSKLGKETAACAKHAGDKSDVVSELGELLSSAGSDLDSDVSASAK